MYHSQELSRNDEGCGFGEALTMLSSDSTVNMSLFAELNRCPTVEWRRFDVQNPDYEYWLASVGHPSATEAERKAMLNYLQRVFRTMFSNKYPFVDNEIQSNYTLFENNYRFALDIRTPLDVDTLQQVEQLCNQFKGPSLRSVAITLALNSSSVLNVSTQLKCLKEKANLLRIGGVRATISHDQLDLRTTFAINGAFGGNEQLKLRDDEKKTLALCYAKVGAVGNLPTDGKHCQATIVFD